MARLLISLIFIPLSLLAQVLPDEINVAPYQEQLESLEREIANLNEDLSDLNQELEQNQRIYSEVQSDIQRTNDSIYNQESQLDQSFIERENLRSDKRTLREKILKGEERLDRLDRRSRNLSQKISREQAINKPAREAIEALKIEIKEKRNTLVKTQEKIANQETKIKELNKGIQTNQEKLKNQKTKLSDLLVEKPKLERKISDLKNQIIKLKSEIAGLVKPISTLELKVAKLKAKEKSLKAQIKKMEESISDPTQLAALKKELGQTKSTRLLAEESLNEKKQVKLQKKEALAKKKSRLENLSEQLSLLPESINQTKQKIANLESKIEESQQTKNEFESKLTQSKQKESALLTSIPKKEERLRVKQEDFKERKLAMKDLKTEFNQVELNYSETLKKQSRRKQRSSQIVSRLQILAQRIPELEIDIQNLTVSLTRLDSELLRSAQNIDSLQENINQMRAQKEQSTQEREVASTNVQSRQKLFQNYLLKAQELGASQTQSANILGESRGKSDAYSIASKMGSSTGNEIGTSQANYWGYVKGEVLGYQAGRTLGRQSSSDISRASTQAKRDAKEAAINYAQTTLKPRFFNSIYEQSLGNSTSLNNKSNHFSDNHESSEQASLTSFQAPASLKTFNGNEPTTTEYEESERLITSLDERIQEMKNSLSSLYSKANSLSSANSVFNLDEGIPYSQVNCQSVYKGLPVFKKACKESHQETFAKKYENSKYDKFKEIYEPRFKESLQASSDSSTNALYQGIYSQAFQLAKNDGLNDGKKEIFNETYQRVYDSTYSQELIIEKSIAKEQAKKEVNTWINNNASITLTSLSSDLKKPESGSRGKLLFKLKNISAVGQKKSVVIQVKKIKNVSLNKKTIILNNMRGNAEVTQSDISFQIDSNLSANTVVIISGDITFPATKYQPSRIEKFEFKKVLSRNAKMIASTTYNDRPKIKKGKRVHELMTSISPEIEGVPEGYTVKLKTSQSEFINFKTSTELKTGSINYGQSAEVSFKYTFERIAKKKKVSLELQYLYLNKVLKTEIIELFPR